MRKLGGSSDSKGTAAKLTHGALFSRLYQESNVKFIDIPVANSKKNIQRKMQLK